MSSGVADTSKLRAVGVGVGVGVTGLIAGGLLTIVGFVLLRIFVEVGDFGLLVLSLLLTQGVGMIGAALAYVTWRGVGLGYIRARLPSLTDVVWVVVAYVVAIIGVWIIGFLLTLADAPTAENSVAETASRNPEVLLLLIPGSFLLIGPGEELLFRGVVQGRIREAFGPVPGVLIASVIFAAVHVVALVGNPRAILISVGVLMIPSLILGAAYEYTGNIVVPILIHGAYNATLFALFYVSLRFGGDMSGATALLS